MGRTAIWKAIAASLTSEIAGGRYPQAAKLPTEAQIAARFGVNRHTVRRALAEMADGGLVHSRRGAGVFVVARPTAYPLGRRVRFHQNLQAAGRVPEKRILSLTSRAADDAEAEALDLSSGAAVKVCEGLSLADATPIAIFRSVFPGARFPDILAQLANTLSVTEALRSAGVADYTRRSTHITAKTASATQALHLNMREGAPILRTVSVNVDFSGRPVEYGRTWFAGDRVTLTLDELESLEIPP